MPGIMENMPKAEISNRSSKDLPEVILHIEVGPTSVMQRQAWRRLWMQLLAEAKDKEKDSTS